jgi:hypothetical protein
MKCGFLESLMMCLLFVKKIDVTLKQHFVLTFLLVHIFTQNDL